MIQFANIPLVKQSLKEYIGVAVGAVILYNLYVVATRWTEEKYPASTQKVIILTGQAAILLYAATTPLGVRVITATAHIFLTTQQLESLFGRNDIFAANPWHPRHVASIAAVILAIPAATTGLFAAGVKIYDRTISLPIKRDRIFFSTLFTASLATLFSRPVLHTLNHLFRQAFAKV